MFNKKDYLQYFNELYEVETVMKEEMNDLLKIIELEDARKIIKQIKKDEIRHAKIVQSLIKLI
ncbi:MAG: hypothetical protein ACOYL8_01145 [Patescibacteria group bacterium]